MNLHNNVKRLFIFFLLMVYLPISGATQSINLLINKYSIHAEIANTREARSLGLMHRRKLEENNGMLFVFTEAAPHSMWMVDTLIPLSVAFIDRNGTILNIVDMRPLTEDTHTAAGDALYALEANAGWFAKRGIKVGDSVKGLEQAPRAK